MDDIKPNLCNYGKKNQFRNLRRSAYINKVCYCCIMAETIYIYIEYGKCSVNIIRLKLLEKVLFIDLAYKLRLQNNML